MKFVNTAILLSILFNYDSARQFYYRCDMEGFYKKIGLNDIGRACISNLQGTVYENANGYWPLYNNTINSGTGKATQILGANDGLIYESEGMLNYITLDLSRTALNMGTITQYCLKSGSSCKDGFTLSSWLRIIPTEASTASIDVPIFTINGIGSLDYVAKVWMTANTAGQNLQIQINDGFWRWEFSNVINLTDWTHFSMSFANDIGLTVYINGDVFRTAKVQRSMVVMPTTTYLTVGNVSPGITKALLSVSKVAIWNTIIGDNSSRSLYWNEIGDLVTDRQCRFDNTTLFYYWNVPRHLYQQPYEYNVRWYSDQKDVNGPSISDFKSTPNMTIKNIYRDTAYTFETRSRLIGSNLAQKMSNFTCNTGTFGMKPKIDGKFTVVVLSSEQVELSFHPQPLSNVRIYGELRCYHQNTESCFYRLNGISSLIKEVDGLQARTFFNFTLRAWTDNRLENTFTTVALTYKSWNIASSRVRDVELGTVTWNTISIDWKGPENSESFVIVYRITCQDNKNTSLTLYSTVPTVNITNLRQNTQYTLDIEVGNERSGYNHSGLIRKLKIKTADRNECEEDSTRCGNAAECINIENSYTCRCHEGFVHNGLECNLSQCTEHCPRGIVRGIDWHCMALGTEDVGKCPDGSLGVVRRFCGDLPNGGVGWHEPDFSRCVSEWFRDFLTQALISDDNITTLSSDFKQAIEPKPKLYGGDMKGIADLMTIIVDEIAYDENFINNTNGVTILRDVTKEIVAVASTILDDKNQKAWDDLPEANRSSQASKVILSMEKLSETNARSLENVTTATEIIINSPNAVIKVNKINSNKGKSELGSIENQVILPNDVIKDGVKKAATAYVSYKNMGKLLGAKSDGLKADKKDEVTSDVFSFSLVPKQQEPFDKPIVLIQRHGAKGNFSKPRCVFWKESPPNGGYWSDQGCHVNQTNTTHVTCDCYHLTNFAILMAVTDAGETMAAVHVFALRLISIICIGISLVALFLAFITFWYFRQLKSNRTQLHKNLIVALFLAELLFIIGVDRIALGTGCNFIGIFLHYLFLVAFMLMGLEGVVLYMMLFQVYRAVKRGGYTNWKYIVACWLAPSLIVGPTVAIDWEKYRTSTYCWISSERGFMWSFVGPVLLVILVNIIFFIMAIRMMAKKSRKRDNKSSEIWRWMKGSSILLSILGLTWIIGLFYMNSQTIAIAYIFSILNSLQGLGFFVFHCLADPRVRHLYRNLCCCVDKSAAYYSSSVFSKWSKFQNGANAQPNFKSNQEIVITREDATSMTNVDRLSDKQQGPMDVYEVELSFKTDGEMSDEEHDVPRITRSPALQHSNGQVAM